MSYLRKLWNGEPTVTAHFHGRAAQGWLVAFVPTAALMLIFPGAYFWVLWLVFVSYYANVVGHWSAKQAVRVEQLQDPASPDP